MGYNIAVCGATGNVGREMLNILAERLFPVDELTALASRRSLGTECSFGEKVLKTRDLDTFDFKGVDIALFAVGSEATKKYVKKATDSGCIVIDNSSLFRYHPDVPLIVPEVNPDDIKNLLFEECVFEKSDLENRGLHGFIDKNLDNKVKLFKSPENIKIIVTGGSPGGYSMVCFGSGISITKEIK